MGAYQQINRQPRRSHRPRSVSPLPTGTIVPLPLRQEPGLPAFIAKPPKPQAAGKSKKEIPWVLDKEQPRKDRTSYYRMVDGRRQTRIDYKRAF